MPNKGTSLRPRATDAFLKEPRVSGNLKDKIRMSQQKRKEEQATPRDQASPGKAWSARG